MSIGQNLCHTIKLILWSEKTSIQVIYFNMYVHVCFVYQVQIKLHQNSHPKFHKKFLFYMLYQNSDTMNILRYAFCISILPFCSDTDSSNNLYSTHLTCSEFWVPARGLAYTNITYNVIPLSLCKYTLFSKSEDHLFFATSALSFDKNNRHTTHTVSESAIIFQAEKTVPESDFLNY